MPKSIKHDLLYKFLLAGDDKHQTYPQTDTNKKKKRCVLLIELKKFRQDKKFIPHVKFLTALKATVLAK